MLGVLKSLIVIKVKDPQSVGKGKTKQEVIVADDTGSICLTLWGDDIGKLTEAKSYQLNRVQVHKFLGKYELTFPRFGDIHLDEITGSDVQHVTAATIVGVGQIEATLSCINCKKTILSNSLHMRVIIECNFCATKQKIRTTKSTAKLYVEDSTGNLFTLRAYQDILVDIAKSVEITADKLLQSEPQLQSVPCYHLYHQNVIPGLLWLMTLVCLNYCLVSCIFCLVVYDCVFALFNVHVCSLVLVLYVFGTLVN